MTQTMRLGLLPAALGLGVAGDALLRATPWGVNVLLWTALGLGVLWELARRSALPLAGEGMWLAAPALCFAGGLAWRDSATLRALDILGLACCLGIGAARTRAGQIRLAGFWEYAGEIARSGLQTLFGSVPLLRETDWNAVPRGGWLPRALAVGRGLALVLPLLLLFGALLSAADAVYQRLLSQAFQFNFAALLGHFGWALLLAWLTAGFGRALLSERPERAPRFRPAALGAVETGTILGLLNLLFLSFVLVQVRYFFGGAATVAATAGLTYTQYARSGFFELVWVAALVLPLLLGLHRLQNPESARAERLFAAQAAVQVALLFVILASALLRMRLYEETFGLTELRLYTTAFMGWLAVIFAWFAVTVLRGKREHFAFGAAAAAFALIAGLHALNPDALIVRTNASRNQFDASYAASLSADAVPALVAALPGLPPAARAEVVAQLPAWSRSAGDWRSWNWSRMTARHAVQSLHGN